MTIGVVRSVAPGTGIIGVPVDLDGAVPGELGFDRATLAASGFDGEVGQTLVLPRRGAPSFVAIGIGDPAGLDASKLRDAAAAFARAVGKHDRLATTLADMASVQPELAGQAVVEGVLLARYHHDALKRQASGTELVDLTLLTASERLDALTKGAERGRITAAAQLARDLANAPPAHLTAGRLAEVAEAVAADRGLDIEIFDKDALAELGCGGLLGVNAGSVEPPRMIKLTYQPRGPDGKPAKAAGHLTVVGKGMGST